MSSAQKKLYDGGYVSPRKGVRNSDEAIKSATLKLNKPIIQYTLDGIFVKEWSSVKSTREAGFGSNYVIQCCKNKRKSYKNYIWKYKE